MQYTRATVKIVLSLGHRESSTVVFTAPHVLNADSIPSQLLGQRVRNSGAFAASPPLPLFAPPASSDTAVPCFMVIVVTATRIYKQIKFATIIPQNLKATQSNLGANNEMHAREST